ncbi:hypothetical protein P148_SR1C00001G0328 [candidate division SR1 bacterium RAAC1_SR1_1]|nr:hypothetical protein P148_SR1C00001G0328 [candidate division SR1 bacterium RAAC1_SR1_1]
MFFHNTSIAAVRTWTGAVSTNWSNPANWLEGSIPGPTDDVYFTAADPLQGCLLDISTSIHHLSIDPIYGYLITFPAGKTLSISGDLYIGNPWIIWDNNANIIFNGSTDQHIEIDNYVDWPFYDLTINKPSGNVILDSDIIVSNIFNLISGSIDCNGFSGPCPPPCTPPQTGGIYHIANDFAL